MNTKIAPVLKITIITILSFVLILGMLSIILSLANVERYKPYIADKFFQATGHKIILAGPLKIRYSSGILILASDITVFNPNQFESGNVLKVKSLGARLSILPLVKKHIEIDNISLDNVEVSLSKDGKLNNWALPESGDKKKNSNLKVNLRKIELKNLTIAYKDKEKKEAYKTESLQIVLNKDGGSIEISEKEIRFNEASFDLNDSFHTKFDSIINLTPTLSYTGKITSKFSAPETADSLNYVLDPNFKKQVYNDCKLDSHFKGSESFIELSQLHLSVGKNLADGNIKLGFKPYKINQKLKFTNIKIEDFTNINGLKIILKKASWEGNWVAKNNFRVADFDGKQNINIQGITLYGFSIRKFSDAITKAINDASKAYKIVSYTQNKSTLKQIRDGIEQIADNKQKNYSETSNLGTLNFTTVAKHGVVKIASCKLNSSDIDALCGGYFNFMGESLNFVAQGRVLSSDKQNLINYVYIPYYIRGSFSHPESDIDWKYIAEEISTYYSKSKRDKPYLNRVLDGITGIFSSD